MLCSRSDCSEAARCNASWRLVPWPTSRLNSKGKNPPGGTPKRKGRGFLRVVKAVAFVSVIVVVQIVVASMLAPTAKDTDAIG